jgi:hypothetical protein
VEITCRVYKPRDPRKTPLFRLFDSLYERVKGAWEDRFERAHGFWRGLVDEVVKSYLACGLWQGGFARVRCRRCPEEFLVAELAAFLQDEVVEQVGHAQWVFTIPKMLRIYFLHHRELLGALSLAAYETVKELMAAAVEEKGFRPGMVSVVQTFGEGAKFHPHVHALCSRGGWAAPGEWIPLPYVDEGAAEKLFPEAADRAALRRRWAELIRRVYEVDPLLCPRCGGEMRVIGFITQPALIDRILDHLRSREKVSRPPPHSPQPVACPA